jgi:hypothetical protein
LLKVVFHVVTLSSVFSLNSEIHMFIYYKYLFRNVVRYLKC